MTTRRMIFSTVAILAMVFLYSCTETEPSDLTLNSIIPAPVQVHASEGYFSLNKKTQIVYMAEEPELNRLSGILSEIIKEEGFVCDYKSTTNEDAKNRIYLHIADNMNLPEEGYMLDINQRNIKILAGDVSGIFHGIQSIRQLLQLEGPDLNKSSSSIEIPSGKIMDYPEYTYRGMMLDVSRHFFKTEDVKKLIDYLAFYKINMLHMHLSDDQGWRIEIKSWPELTKIGGSTEVGGGEGGFYTQEEFKELVAYADSKYITIVPEIDMPGHTNAALASYAELNCNDKTTDLYTGTRVGFSTLCTDKEITYKFVDDVVREISDMISGPYFHIGGDESHVTALPDYTYFINKVRDIVISHNKTMIGWDEISHGNLAEGDIAQYWASAENASRAVEKGAQLILSPASKCYLDMKYDSSTVLGLHWAGYVDVDAAYNWKPTELVKNITKEDILGIESPLWAETIETLDDIEFLAFPRIIGHAEIGWSQESVLDWESYKDRLAVHLKLMDSMGVNYYKSDKITP